MGAPGLMAGFGFIAHILGRWDASCSPLRLTLADPDPVPPHWVWGRSHLLEGGNRAGALGLEPRAGQSPELMCGGAACGPGLGRQRCE